MFRFKKKNSWGHPWVLFFWHPTSNLSANLIVSASKSIHSLTILSISTSSFLGEATVTTYGRLLQLFPNWSPRYYPCLPREPTFKSKAKWSSKNASSSTSLHCSEPSNCFHPPWSEIRSIRCSSQPTLLFLLSPIPPFWHPYFPQTKQPSCSHFRGSELAVAST